MQDLVLGVPDACHKGFARYEDCWLFIWAMSRCEDDPEWAEPTPQTFRLGMATSSTSYFSFDRCILFYVVLRYLNQQEASATVEQAEAAVESTPGSPVIVEAEVTEAPARPARRAPLGNSGIVEVAVDADNSIDYADALEPFQPVVLKKPTLTVSTSRAAASQTPIPSQPT